MQKLQTPWRHLETATRHKSPFVRPFLCVSHEKWPERFYHTHLTLFLIPPPLFRFWIWEFLSTWEASCHMVRQPTLCCSRGLWGPTVWGSTAGHLGEMLKNTTLGFLSLHLDSSDMCLCVFSCSEYGGGAVRAGVWCVTIWWTNSACTPTESPGRKVPYPLLHDWR